ncbi:MAG: ABC transporter permease [Hyphomicrobiales bacterium]|nr:ABC transporter permease [Hyphomicrobiales bacterium]MBV8664063.1 ABC transporter permease [Hyphomicrobiales bacterium]
MNDRPLHWSLRLAAAAALVFLMLPVVVVVFASFSATAYLTIPPQGWTLRWFAQALGDPTYLAAIVFSLELAVAATVVAALLAIPACYALHHRWIPFGEAIASFVMSPLVFPAVVIGVALLQYMSALGLRGNFAVLTLAHVVIVTPYIVRTALAGLSGLDPALEEAARVLGASRLSAFMLVALPLMRMSLLAGFIFAFITSFDEASVTLFLLPPGQATLPVTIFSAIDLGVDPSIAAISTLLIVATIVLLALAERLGGARRLL